MGPPGRGTNDMKLYYSFAMYCVVLHSLKGCSKCPFSALYDVPIAKTKKLGNYYVVLMEDYVPAFTYMT